MLSTKKVLASFLMVAALTGCAESVLTNKSGYLNKANIGGLTGAITGAWIGSKIGKGTGNVAAIAAGTILGAFSGHSIGSSLDKADEIYAAQAFQSALEYGRTGTQSTWRNPDSGHYGSFYLNNTHKRGTTYCRELTETVNVGGRSAKAYVTACRQPDGTWEIVE